jgi:hypothetical protein
MHDCNSIKNKIAHAFMDVWICSLQHLWLTMDARRFKTQGQVISCLTALLDTCAEIDPSFEVLQKDCDASAMRQICIRVKTGCVDMTGIGITSVPLTICELGGECFNH